MTFYIISLCAALILLVGYSLTCVIMFKQIPESLSETSYLFSSLKKMDWPFTVFCFLLAFLICPTWMELSAPTWQWLVFLSAGGILFAGATPLFKESLQKQVHYIGGIIAFVSGIGWMIMSGYGTVAIGVFATTFIACLHMMSAKCFVFFGEVFGYLGVTLILLSILLGIF